MSVRSLQVADTVPGSPLGSRPISHSPERRFYQVGGGHNLDKMGALTEIFNRILTPLYGSQDKALKQIEESRDRVCFLLYEGEYAVGVLQFKTVLSDEYADMGADKSIEIKSLFVDQAAQNSGKGLGSSLVDKLIHEVEALGLGHKGIHVTVSETKPESLLFFKKKGFEIIHAWKDRYQPGVTEYLLSCSSKVSAAAAAALGLERSAPVSRPRQEGDVPELLHIIHEAHLDDIHALKKLSDGTFISGSKDNSLYKWSETGRLVRIVDEVEPTYRREQNWITAVEVLNDQYWLSGDRSGRVFLWKTSGEFVREIKLKTPRVGEHFSHIHNAKRVNCLAAGLSSSVPTFFVGFPTLFDEYNFFEGRTETSTKVHQNDWVYRVQPLTPDKVMTVTGCTVDIWRKTAGEWRFAEHVVSEGKKVHVPSDPVRKWQRPFISALIPIADNKQFAFTVFDGSVKILDLESKRITREWKEHKGKVWAIESIGNRLLASGGEDQIIKLWDVRQDRSVHSIMNRAGQVTSLLNLKDNILLAGSFPEGGRKAEIRFYELRK